MNKILCDSHELNETICGRNHNVEWMSFHDFEIQLLVTEEKILQVLSRANGVHKFVEEILWRIQLDKRHRGFV